MCGVCVPLPLAVKYAYYLEKMEKTVGTIQELMRIGEATDRDGARGI